MNRMVVGDYSGWMGGWGIIVLLHFYRENLIKTQNDFKIFQFF